jgi:hypothetical protein
VGGSITVVDLGGEGLVAQEVRKHGVVGLERREVLK